MANEEYGGWQSTDVSMLGLSPATQAAPTLICCRSQHTATDQWLCCREAPAGVHHRLRLAGVSLPGEAPLNSNQSLSPAAAEFARKGLSMAACSSCCCCCCWGPGSKPPAPLQLLCWPPEKPACWEVAPASFWLVAAGPPC